ncbi:MAG: hypothetical protein U0Q22_13305 [Acidimicrobiales bacterium]
MALYMSAARRRRAAVAAAVVGVLVGLVVGALVGRGTATSVDDAIANARSDARSLVSSLQVLPLEYRKVVEADDGDAARAADIVDRALAGERAVLDAAPWLSPTDVAAVRAALAAVHDAPGGDVAADRFDERVDAAVTEVEQVFGLKRS